MTWIRCSGYFSTIERTRRWTNGFCDVTWRVSSRVPGSNCAIAARGSIAVGCRRWFTNRWFTTTSASWKTLSTSPPAKIHLHAPLSGASPGSGARPGFVALSTSVTTGSGSYSTSTRSRAFSAMKEFSATTTATASPAYRTTSRASGGYAYPPLAREVVRYAGEAVAVVVAENSFIAENARDLVEVEYDPLPVVTDVESATKPGRAPLPGDAPDNGAC